MVQGSLIALPLAQLRIRPAAPLAARQLHAGQLKCDLRGGTLRACGVSGLVLQRGSVTSATVPTRRKGESPQPISIFGAWVGNQLLTTAPHKGCHSPPFLPVKIASSARRRSGCASSPM